MQRVGEPREIADAALFLAANSANGIITREVYNELSSAKAAYPALRQVDRFIETNVFEFASLSSIL